MMRCSLPLLFLLVPVVASAQITRTNPESLFKPTGYTHVVEVTGPAKTVYIAGQIAADKDGKVVGAGDMKAQAEQVFRNLDSALTTGGAKFSDVVKMNIYVTDIDKAPSVREVRARYLTDVTPAITMVQVVHLARPELMVEIEVIAVVPSGKHPRSRRIHSCRAACRRRG